PLPGLGGEPAGRSRRGRAVPDRGAHLRGDRGRCRDHQWCGASYQVRSGPPGSMPSSGGGPNCSADPDGSNRSGAVCNAPGSVSSTPPLKPAKGSKSSCSTSRGSYGWSPVTPRPFSGAVGSDPSVGGGERPAPAEVRGGRPGQGRPEPPGRSVTVGTVAV